MPWITFEPFGVRLPCADGESVFEVGRRNRVPIASSCQANASCGLCRMKVASGQEFLSPVQDHELMHLVGDPQITRERLSCQARVTGGDVIVRLPRLHTEG